MSNVNTNHENLSQEVNEKQENILSSQDLSLNSLDVKERLLAISEREHALAEKRFLLEQQRINATFERQERNETISQKSKENLLFNNNVLRNNILTDITLLNTIKNGENNDLLQVTEMLKSQDLAKSLNKQVTDNEAHDDENKG